MIKRLGRLLAIPGVLLGATLATPRAAGAQAKFEVTPFLGSFYALAKLCTDCNANNDGSNFEGRQLNSAVFGGRLSYWVSRTIGVEAAFGYTPSRVEEREDLAQPGFSQAVSATGTIMMVNGRLLFRPARTNLHFILGGGIVSRSGELWKLLKDNQGTKLTSVGGVLGMGVRASVTPRFSLNISAEANLYSFDPTFGVGADPSNGSQLQADLLVSVGVPIALSR
ncbi:MAG: hypothetical protein ACREMW_06295 [Gemmatimonadales bacterium]